MRIDIQHHPFRGDISIRLSSGADIAQAQLYFIIVGSYFRIKGGLVMLTQRGIRIEKAGQGVFFPTPEILEIKSGEEIIWPEPTE